MLLHILVICRSTLKKANAHLIAEMASSTSDHHDLVDAPSPAYINVNPIVLSSDKDNGVLHLMFMMPGCAEENIRFIPLRTTADACEYKVASDVELRRATAPNYRMSYRGFCSIPVELKRSLTTCTAQDGIAHVEARKHPRMYARPRVQPRFVYPKYSAHKVSIYRTDSESDGS